ncbi:MAG TPA: hypothetical protein V6D47_18245 [Oscillatoriaceae cyanobacterium]
MPLSSLASQPLTKAATKAAPSLVQRAEADVVGGVHDVLTHSTLLNKMMSPFSGPFVKHMFNAPAKAGAYAGPAALTDLQIEQARKLMAANFKPQDGKVLIALSGGGGKTVHSFVVTGVGPDGKVQITQAIAQTGTKPETYKGVGGFIRKILDKILGNKPLQMQGVVTEDWSTYAKESQRNTFVLMQLDTTPQKAQDALQAVKADVGKPYDETMLSSDPATPATNQALYCTEVASSFVNGLLPGTVKQSTVSGYPVFQVADFMRASDVNGGPLKVLSNVGNRLDIKDANPIPKS